MAQTATEKGPPYCKIMKYKRMNGTHLKTYDKYRKKLRRHLPFPLYVLVCHVFPVGRGQHGLQLNDIRCVGWQILTALQFLHEKGLAHGERSHGVHRVHGQIKIKLGGLTHKVCVDLPCTMYSTACVAGVWIPN